MIGGQPPPAAVEVDQHLLRVGKPDGASASAIAVPDTIDTSCSADGPPNRTDDRRSQRLDAGHAGNVHPGSGIGQGQPAQSPTNSTSNGELDPIARRTSRGRGRQGRARRRRCRCLVVDDEVGVLLGDGGTTDPEALEAGRCRSAARPSPGGGLRKTLPADGMPSGWCAWRQRRMSSRRARMSSGSAGREPERRRRRLSSADRPAPLDA